MELSRIEKDLITKPNKSREDMIALEAYAFSHLGDAFACFRAINRPLPNVADIINEPQLRRAHYDRKRFTGEQVHDALELYFSKLIEEYPDVRKLARKGKNRDKFKNYLAELYHAVSSVPTLTQHFDKDKHYYYENIREKALKENVHMIKLDDALINVTVGERIVVPQIVYVIDSQMAPFYVDMKEKFLQKWRQREVFIEKLENVAHKLEVSASQLSIVLKDQAYEHAHWLAYAIQKLPEVIRGRELVYQT
ncbi:hypothetical protein KY330_00125 [Candidatus Woesearchaeota archaeon]|nr:hypothetical protein [Candidatus Woesearchaeota archaeon]